MSIERARLEHLLTACEQMLASLDQAEAAVNRAPAARRPRNIIQFLDRERAVYSFGAALLKELRHPGGAGTQLFPGMPATSGLPGTLKAPA